jgi:hypothetical protein
LIGEDDATVVELGHLFKAEGGKRATKRYIKSLETVKKYLGAETFMKLATVTLKNCDDYLTPEQKAVALGSERGGRSVKMIKRQP